MNKLLAYLSHPVGPGNGEDTIRRGDNLANAGAWLKFLVLHTKWAVCCPWWAYVANLDESMKPRGMVDNAVHIERADIVVQVGSHVSHHMAIERTHAARNRIPIVDLTELGAVPPLSVMTEAEITKVIRDKTQQALHAGYRSVWMPPLSLAEIETLQDARKRLVPVDGDDHARAVIDRILGAAIKQG